MGTVLLLIGSQKKCWLELLWILEAGTLVAWTILRSSNQHKMKEEIIKFYRRLMWIHGQTGGMRDRNKLCNILSEIFCSFSSTGFFNITNAQSATLGEPFFVEKGKVTGQKEIGPNRTQYTFASNGTMNDNIEVTNTGEYVSVSKGNNLVFELPVL